MSVDRKLVNSLRISKMFLRPGGEAISYHKICAAFRFGNAHIGAFALCGLRGSQRASERSMG
jgi:hypothetical protein